jgi:signal transduction histidine kinase
VVSAIVRTLERIHKQSGIKVAVQLDPDLRFRGERQDLEEIVGNLVDNAFKWSGGSIAVTVRPSLTPVDSRISWFDICVEDDGPGLPDGGAEIARERGKRLDETKPGSGLGLNIVIETAAMYGGQLNLGRSRLGGSKPRLSCRPFRRRPELPQLSAADAFGKPRSR